VRTEREGGRELKKKEKKRNKDQFIFGVPDLFCFL
jgi:hypothetical protein